MKIYIASDHAGFALKSYLFSKISDLGHNIIDLGPDIYDQNDDYPQTLLPLILKVSEENFDYSQKKDNVVNSFGIVIGHSGQGEAIVSNRIPGIRAAVYYGGPKEIITLSREHNNANILSLGANFLSNEEALESVLLWLQTKFTEESRHQRRNELLDSIS